MYNFIHRKVVQQKKTSPPQSHLGRAHCYPHVGRRMHSPTACASCSLYNAQWSITEHYRTVWSVVGRYGMLQKHCGSTTGCYFLFQETSYSDVEVNTNTRWCCWFVRQTCIHVLSALMILFTVH